MAIDPNELRIVHYPDPVLHERATPVEVIDDAVRAVARRMLELMHAAPGVGLAAPQVGLGWRMFVANPTGEPADDRVFINPVLSDPTPETEDAEEGCLSLPGIDVVKRRPAGITITAVDQDEQPVSLRATGIEARIWQHEFDHLEGVLIIDRMSPIDRAANRQALKALEAEA